MKHSCTIITASYLPYALALHESLNAYGSEVKLHVLVSDLILSDAQQLQAESKGLSIYYPDQLNSENKLAEKLFKKYNQNFSDKYRWSMKSIFLLFLIEKLNDYGHDCIENILSSILLSKETKQNL